jgi:hypothetical protein
MVPRCRIPDLAGGICKQRCLGTDQLAGSQVRVPGGRADHELAAIGADACQLGQPADVDQDLGLGEAQLHHRQQRVAAGQQLGVVAVLSEQAERVRGRLGGDVVKLCGDHAVTSAFVWSAAARTDWTML